MANFVNLGAFRTLRVLRITKLLRSLKFMKIIVAVISSCVSNCLNISYYFKIVLLMIIVSFIFTLLGTQLFGGTLSET